MLTTLLLICGVVVMHIALEFISAFVDVNIMSFWNNLYYSRICLNIKLCLLMSLSWFWYYNDNRTHSDTRNEDFSVISLILMSLADVLIHSTLENTIINTFDDKIMLCGHCNVFMRHIMSLYASMCPLEYTCLVDIYIGDNAMLKSIFWFDEPRYKVMFCPSR